MTWLQRLREDAGLTQLDVAARLRASTGDPWDQSKVSRYESSPDKAPLGGVLDMMQVLGVENPLLHLKGGAKDEDLGVDAGVPLESLHRDLNALRDYIESEDWQSSDLSVQVPSTADLKVLCERLAEKPLVAFFGKFDAGKSTLVNAILGANRMPTSYQPTTRVITYVRHLSDRPNWLKEDVLMLGSGFDPKEWADEGHCMKHKVVAGGLETLQAHGTHRGEHGNSDASYALVFIDSPVLHSCSIIDLPGTENDTKDTDKATAQQIAYDVAVFADTVTGFLGEGALLRLGEVVRGLPPVEGVDPSIGPLANLFVVATHAHRDITDKQLQEDILAGGQARAWRQLGETALKSRAERTKVEISRKDFEERFFAFYKGFSERSRALLTDLERVLKVDLPHVMEIQADADIQRFKHESAADLASTIEFYQSAINDREAVAHELDSLLAQEPNRIKVVKYAQQIVELAIARHRAEMRENLKMNIQGRTHADTIERLIRRDFPSKRDAQQNAAALVVEQIHGHFETEIEWRSEEVNQLIEKFIGEYDQAALAGQATPGRVRIPFNAKGAFAGGLAGLAAVGGLALWASTLGNLGAYIIVAQAVSAVSALGFTTGGTAVWISAVAAIGGPVVIAIGIVVLAGVLGWGVLRGSWEGRLAKRISSELRKSGIALKYLENMEKYWNDTADAFASCADRTEKAWQAHLENLRDLIDETDLRALKRRLVRLEELRVLFLGLPWRFPM